MGTYLNPNNENFRSFVATGTYVDKTMLVDVLNQKNLNVSEFKFVCVSRPRRFGKSIAEDMLSAYYSKGADSKELFAPYKLSKTEHFEKHLNKYNVLKIDLNAMYSKWRSLSPADREGQSFMGYVAKLLCADFAEYFSDVKFPDELSVADFIQNVYAQKKETFIIIIDEYDVLVREQVPQEEFSVYLAFLNSLFKNRELLPAISLAYITGILPIIKDKIQSKLNTFHEYTMLDAGPLAEFVGFTADEVQSLCEKYQCSFEECKSWYDGYQLDNYEIYNPQAVYNAMISKKFKSYWTATSSYTVVSDKICMNFSGTKDDVISMLGGGRIRVNVEKYENTIDAFYDKDDVFTYLIHLGYLAYDEKEGECYIPNREILNEWQKAIKNNEDYFETDKIISASRELLEATLAGDEKSVAAALDKSHYHVTSNLSYNNEKSLQSAIYLAYIYALNNYVITKEMPAGKGFADIVYIPFDKTKAALIIELKHNKSTETALNQIKEKKYFECLANWQGDILFVGVNYDEKTKHHECQIEEFYKD